MEQTMISALKTFTDHMQFEEEIHDWKFVAHYEDNRIFFFAHMKQVKFGRMMELSPFVNNIDKEGMYYVQMFTKPREIWKYQRKFAEMLGKKINRSKDFVAVVDYDKGIVDWSYKIGDIIK